MANQIVVLRDVPNDNFYGCYNYDNPYETCLGCGLCEMHRNSKVVKCDNDGVYHKIGQICPVCGQVPTEVK